MTRNDWDEEGFLGMTLKTGITADDWDDQS